MLLKRSMHLMNVQSWTYLYCGRTSTTYTLCYYKQYFEYQAHTSSLNKKKFKLNTMWTWKLCFTYQSDVNLHLFNFNILHQLNEMYTGKNHLKKVFQHELTWEYPKNLHFHYQSLQTARRLDNYCQLILYHKIRDHFFLLPRPHSLGRTKSSGHENILCLKEYCIRNTLVSRAWQE